MSIESIPVLLVQQPHFYGLPQAQKVLARLLCSSKEVQRQHLLQRTSQSTGGLDASYTNIFTHVTMWDRSSLQFEQWLVSHGHVVRSLSINLDAANWLPNGNDVGNLLYHNSRWIFRELEQRFIASAMMRANSILPQGLRLQDFACSSASMEMLEALPASHLTSLKLGDSNNRWQQYEQMDPEIFMSITHLTNLQSLEIHQSPMDLQAFPKLTNVTFGSGADVPASQLQLLPSSLQQLNLQEATLEAMPDEEGGQQSNTLHAVHISHLARLTELQLGENHMLVSEESSTQLPASLVVLSVGDCDDPSVLMGLTQLKELNLLSAEDTSDDLCKLCSYVPRLSGLHLGYSRAVHCADCSCDTWHCLPVRSLAFSGYFGHCQHTGSCSCESEVSKAVIDSISRVEGLTSLVLDNCHVDATPEQLQASLAQLSGLQELQLTDSLFPGRSVASKHTLRNGGEVRYGHMETPIGLEVILNKDIVTDEYSMGSCSDDEEGFSGDEDSEYNSPRGVQAASSNVTDIVDWKQWCHYSSNEEEEASSQEAGVQDGASSEGDSLGGSDDLMDNSSDWQSDANIAAGAATGIDVIRSYLQDVYSGPKAEYVGNYIDATVLRGCNLSALRCLKLDHLGDRNAAISAITSAKQLTCLHLTYGCVDDVVLGQLVCNLPKLHELNVSYNPLVTDVVMPAIAEWLLLLTLLDMRCTRVSKGSATCLDSLLYLEKLLLT